MAMAALCLESSVLGNIANNLFKVYRNLFNRFVARLKASDGEQALDQFIETVGFAINTVQSAVGLRSASLPGQLQGNGQACEWGSKFVRNIGQQSALSGDQVLQAFRHAIEIAHQFCHFVMATGTWDSGAGGEIAGGKFLSGSPELHNRRCQIACEDV